MGLIGSDKYNTATMCGTLCLQHKVNEFLWDLKRKKASLDDVKGEKPMHVNFI
jgi:hypothetical protein